MVPGKSESAYEAFNRYHEVYYRKVDKGVRFYSYSIESCISWSLEKCFNTLSDKVSKAADFVSNSPACVRKWQRE